ncbi:PREDICTED: probable protein phosphatase 2C 24 [Fragaria vesca subsp. vesca]|uniref:probable protein phosphatase 2C 24 n=1 Tax=Fragaria vesca subsp. vesca TaxID=101020 RepID=UPI0002C3084A|nr:PREDICTED: probable protein phosphatase 2C 24 [Fragaria vesca subsp. vesca]
MAEICCGVVSDNDSSTCEGSSRAARRRRIEIRRFKFVSGVAAPAESTKYAEKRKRLECYTSQATEKFSDDEKVNSVKGEEEMSLTISAKCPSTSAPVLTPDAKFGMASVCGRRRDMEDAVAIHPFFCQQDQETTDLHYYAVYDGHGCSHVATKCKERFHEVVKEEIENEAVHHQEWQRAMERSFLRMDKEVTAWIQGAVDARADCRCELQQPECEAVGSTAVVAVVTPDKIIVANCGDSRAVLCRKGKPVPLSSDHKPDRPDELSRIEEAGGRVIYWDGPRVLGVLAMSRAIGDNYLKPFVCCEPEVTVTDRTAEDDCLILASDGLWDVVSNETACGVALMCLRGRAHAPPMESEGAGVENSDKECSDASTLLTKLALARQSTDNVSVVVVNLKRNT